MTGEDWPTRYLDSLRARGLAATTLASYRRDLDALCGFLGDACWWELDANRLRAFLAAERRRGLGVASLRRRLAAARGFLAFLRRQGVLDRDPSPGVSPPRAERALPTVPEAETLAALLALPARDVLEWRDRAMLELFYSSGLRLTELVGLDLADLDLREGLARVRGKGARTRMVPVGSRAREALRDWLSRRGGLAGVGETALFVGEHGHRLGARSVQQRLARWCRRGGVRLHPHQLRHACASHLLQASGDLRAVQELLGHARLNTTQIYTRLDFQHLAQVYDRAHPRARKKKD